MSALGHTNPRVLAAAKLHRKKERQLVGQTLIEGPGLLKEVLDAGIALSTVFALPTDAETADLAAIHGVDVTIVDKRALGKLSGTKTPRGPVGVIDIPDHQPFRQKNIVVACGISDPGNMGTLIRTAAAFGWDVGHTEGTTDPWSPKVLRSAVGGHFRCRIHSVESPNALHRNDYAAVASVVSGGDHPDVVEGWPVALLVGGEAAGLLPEWRESAIYSVTVPMPGGTESLNAAVAGSLLMFALSQRIEG